jgi:acyl-ACP thioesterase
LTDYVVDRPCPITFDRFEIQPDAPKCPVSYKVKYSDIDLNGHFTSFKYMESILDLFDLDTYRTRSIARFDITYQSEAFFGAELTLNKMQINENEYVTTISRDGKLICKAKMILRIEG